MSPVSSPAHPEKASLSLLCLLCLKIGTLSFGGGLSGWFYQEFVQRHRLVDDDDFAASLAIAQMLPGANVVNLIICLGEQLRGPAGSVTCLASFLVGPFFAVLGLYALFDYFADLALLPIFFNGIAFAAIGLLLMNCIRGVRRAMRFPPFAVIAAATAVMVGVLQWPLIPVVLALSPVSIFLAWKRG
ncbi:chromate transporter [Neorhizobium sp. NCHU2750]|uniref:chromate transporter n=1 Tax=Neorhizobium sp. NCHU2750 TaxID=1825976 RepID=UPI000EB70CBB|nr:chromate transporter [Neorhizobium sp. NCHU2750]